MSWTPWSFTNPFIAYTPILADEMNPNLNGISASFTYVADELNQFRPRLPSSFIGSPAIPDMNYHNTLLGIDKEGNMTLVDQGAFKAAGDKDFFVNETGEPQLTISGEDHAKWWIVNNSDPVVDQVVVVVGQATTMIEDVPTVATGATILFTQDTDTPLIFAPIEGVTIKSSGVLQAYGRNSTVTLMAVNESTWILGGDVLPKAVVV